MLELGGLRFEVLWQGADRECRDHPEARSKAVAVLSTPILGPHADSRRAVPFP